MGLAMTTSNAELDQARRAGDAAALTRIGASLLSGTAEWFDPVLGTSAIVEAAECGGAEAAALLAVLAGAGVTMPQDWNMSLNCLRLAAERGWQPARDQLVILSSDRALADRAATSTDIDVWKRLSEAVEVAAWITPPRKIIVSEEPRVRRIEGFASPRVCQWIIGRAQGRLVRAHIYGSKDGGPQLSGTRTNTETDFNIVEADLVLLLLRARIAEATDLPTAAMELTKVLHYSPGEEFELHHDYLDPAQPGLASEIAARGQRLATFLVYLNEDFAGGETVFPKLGLRHRGATGSALYFANVDVQNKPDPRTLHAGLAPLSGEKWLLSQWIRDRLPTRR